MPRPRGVSPRTVSIGAQSFAEMRERGAFLVDKTGFLREWWLSLDDVTLICRPRRFGKTLAMSMAECFFSLAYAGRSDLFEGLEVWDDPAMRAEQGRWPVVLLSLADAKAPSPELLRKKMQGLVSDLYSRAASQLDEEGLAPSDRAFFDRALAGSLDDADIAFSVRRLCSMLRSATGRKAIVLVDEYDTPLQEAWLSGYWDEGSQLVRGLLNSALKTNTYLERGIVTGVTRVAHESIFSSSRRSTARAGRGPSRTLSRRRIARWTRGATRPSW